VQGAFGGLLAAQPGDEPGGEVVRGEAAAGGGQIAPGEERLVQDLDAGRGHPRLGGQIGAGRDVVEQS
jgi:hypothetical protein